MFKKNSIIKHNFSHKDVMFLLAKLLIERAEKKEMYQKSLSLFKEIKSPQIKVIEELLSDLHKNTSD